MKVHALLLGTLALGYASTSSSPALAQQTEASSPLVFDTQPPSPQSKVPVGQPDTWFGGYSSSKDAPAYLALAPTPAPLASPWGMLPPAAQSTAIGPRRSQSAAYALVVRRVARMVSDPDIRRGATRRGLQLVNVAWEDTGRSVGSALGPNISDVTLQVRYRNDDGRFIEKLMPVLRFPNFTDKTADIPANKFYVRVGNHRRGHPLHSVRLTTVLRNLRAFVSVPSSIRGSGNFLSPRDTHFLVSAQAVFLPVPRRGIAHFNPVVFNYQSAPGSPAVLTLLVTRQGTSIKVIENDKRDLTYGGGQELYFNNRGQRAVFTAERKSDVKARIDAHGGPKTEDERTALQEGADCMFLIQVPLRHRNRGVLPGTPDSDEETVMSASAGTGGKIGTGGGGGGGALRVRRESNMETAVLGHGPNLGPYREGPGLVLERDPRFPIRITVQFYKATSSGFVSNRDLDRIVALIGDVYEHADYVGSLVVPPGDPARPTAWQHMPDTWFVW